MELTVDDHLAVIHGELQQVCIKYYDIGLQLKVPVRKLDTIKSQYKDSAGDCLRETIKEWLKSTTTSHTWQFLITALRAPTVGERQVAEKLSEKIPGELLLSFSSSTVRTVVKHNVLIDTCI